MATSTTAPGSVSRPDLALDGATVAPPRAPGQRTRVPQLAIGLFLTVGAALAFVLWNAASVQRVAVLALATDIDRGHVLTLEDLRTVHVATDDPVAVTPVEAATTLLGWVAVGDLQAGTLVTGDQFAQGATLVPGAGVVGLALAPGQYPTPQLRIGDLVSVLEVAGGRRLLVEAAEVVHVEPIGTQGQRFVSLLTGEELAGEVAAAAATGEVRLVLVARARQEASR